MSMPRIGLLHSLSGTMALSEKPLLDAEQMAIDEINRAGGVLGRRIEPVAADGASLPERFAQAAHELLAAGACALFGCWTSASRKAVRPVVEAADSLLWYSVQYEGLEESPCICYSGSCLNQQIMPAVEWTLEQYGNRLFLLGSDYVFPRTANQLIRSLVAAHGGRIVGESYVALGAQDFGDAIAQIRQTQPSAIINTLNGDSNLAFYRQYHAAGLLPAQMPIVATSVAETELESVATAAAGHYACWSYFQSLDTPNNREFVRRFQGRYGENRLVSAPAVTAYAQIYLWKQAAERAGSFAPSQVRRHLPGCELLSPMGTLRIEANQHVSMPIRIGRLQADGQFEIVWRNDEMIAPLPWLGVENLDFPGKAMVQQSLAAFSEGVDYGCLLEREIGERKVLESSLEKAKWDLEGKVEERTWQLAQSIGELRQEIVERQRAEESLRASEEHHRTILQAALDGCWLVDMQGRLREVNAAYCRMSGYGVQELLDLRISDLDVVESADDIAAHIQNIMAQGKDRFETRHRRKDGSIYDVEVSAQYQPVAGGQLVIFLRDVTERKQLEEVRAFLAHTSGGTADEPFFPALARYVALSLGVDFVCIDRLEGDGLTARTVAVWCDGHFEDNVTYALKDTPCGELAGKEVCCFPASVCQFFPRDQVLQDLRAESYVGVTLFDHAGRPIGLIAAISRQPLANRLQAEAILKMVGLRAAAELARLDDEESLRESLHEKEVLLKEVHHRVKNNLQIIASLLHMQADQEHDPAALAVLREAQNRVRSMALIHESLYGSQNLARVNLADYLQTLCARLFQSYAPAGARITLEQRLEAVPLAVTQAIPCGLIVNELLSNVLKYAFPNGRAGHVTLELRVQAGQVHLRVADNGIGLPPALEVQKAPTLGLRLVFLLAGQLQGEVTVERDAGTAFQLTFPLPSPEVTTKGRNGTETEGNSKVQPGISTADGKEPGS